MINKIEHIGIAVKNLANSNETIKKLLGEGPFKEEIVEKEGVSVSFFRAGEVKLELLESLNEDSAISKFIRKRGEGVHHIAFDVDDIHAEMKRLEQEGFTLLSQSPHEGADGKLVCFLHPRSTHGILVELCQDKSA